MFSRDMARTAGLDERDAELAHTAGLLHDIGKFVLSDRVMERGAQLTEADWRGIRRHPDIGADLLRDIGVFGPVGDIVRCHHERIDGRGYPRGLTGAQIPEVAKIVAVAEVYDTLTAPDTYRTPMTSFEALTELRRVAGGQLDERYVEIALRAADRPRHRVPPPGRGRASTASWTWSGASARRLRRRRALRSSRCPRGRRTPGTAATR